MPALAQAIAEIILEVPAPPPAAARDATLHVALYCLFENRQATLLGNLLLEQALSNLSDLAQVEPSVLLSLAQASRIALPARMVHSLIDLARLLESLGDGWASLPVSQLRARLATIRGMGPATIDRFLRDGADKAVYPVDRGTYRILVRHGWLDGGETYGEARDEIESAAPADCQVLSSLARILERVARLHCRPAAPACKGCPLEPWLPPDGPRTPE